MSRAKPQATRRRRARPRRRRSRRSPTTRSCPTATRGARRARRRDRLAVRAALRLAERVRQPARPRGRAASGSARSASTIPPTRSTSRARTCSTTTWKTPAGWVVVRDALTMGPRPADDTSRRTRGRRPTTTPTTCSCGPSSASKAMSRSSWSASPRSTTGARRPTGRWSGRPARRRRHRRRADRPAADRHRARHRGRAGSAARHVLKPGERVYCALSWAEGLAGAARPSRTPTARLDATVRFWRRWLAGPAIPDHRFRDPSSARR